MVELNYVDSILCKNHGQIFELFYDNQLSPIEAVMAYIYSESQRCYDDKNLLACSQDILYFFAMFLEEYIVREKFHYDSELARDALYYVGYLTQYAAYRAGMAVPDFFDDKMIAWLYQNFEILHTQDNEYVMNLLFEMKDR